MTGPLAGIRVIEWAAFHNGPAAGYMLGDLGAEVIKVEPPVTGDPCRGVQSMFDMAMTLPEGRNVQFETANRNKKSIVLDLTKEKGREVLYKLVARSDVFFTNYRKSVARKLGMDYETLRQYNPRLIYATNSAYGSEGPWGERRGFDPVAQALSGAMFAVGDRDDPEPHMISGGIFDQAGATLLVYGILAALVARERMGVGQELECSLLGAAVHLQAITVNSQLWRGRPMPRHSRTRARSPMSNIYRCADGKWLLLTEPQSDRFWHDFCRALGIEHLEKDPRFENSEARKRNYAELNPLLERIFATRTRDEWLEIFRPYDFAYTPIYDFDEMVAEPQIQKNQYIVDFDHPVLGRTKTIGFPVKFSQTPAEIRSCAPAFGQHTEEVLLEVAGYTWDDIAALKEEGVIP